MSACVIFKKDLEKLGRKLMKEFYYKMTDDYLIDEFEEFKLKKKFYDENLVKEFLSFHEKEERQKGCSYLYFGDKRLSDLSSIDPKTLLKNIEIKIENETLDPDLIFTFFDKMDKELVIDKILDFELDEDLFCLKRSFINIYNVVNNDYRELEYVISKC